MSSARGPRVDLRGVLAGRSEGFAAVDGLVALTLIALTIALGLGAVDSARRSATAAVEVRRAGNLLAFLMNASPVREGVVSGVEDGLGWRLEVVQVANRAGHLARLCERAAVATSAKTGRRFTMSTVETCPLDADHE